MAQKIFQFEPPFTTDFDGSRLLLDFARNFDRALALTSAEPISMAACWATFNVDYPLNTQPKIKRHELPEAFGDLPDGTYAAGIVEKQIGAKFAKFVTSFEELEAHMSTVLSVLLGGHDHVTAGYVLRSIRSPASKRTIMRDLLQKAKVNQHLSFQYDQILSEYGTVATERNQVVHGRWFTLIPSDDSESRRRVFLSRSNEHDLAFYLAEEVDPKDFDPWFERLDALVSKIRTVAGDERAYRAQQEQEIRQFHQDAQDPRNHQRLFRGKTIRRK